MMHRKFLKYFLSLIVFVTVLDAQELQKYEPPDGKVIHGLGQYTEFYYSDAEYWQFVKDYEQAVGKIPLVYSVYAYLDPYISSIDSADFLDIVSNHDYPYLLQVGYSLMDSSVFNGDINIPVDSILNGQLDSQIINIAQRIKELDQPVFFRPGFEFGENNSGIHSDPDVDAEDFKNIWIYLYSKFNENDVKNASWVWNTVNPHVFNFSEWYPGDQYVDWWGINYFTTQQITQSQSFLDSAMAHNKPVMICESSPIQEGGTTNSNNWENFFVPYFNQIDNNKHIKAFIYINSSWEKEPFFNWPDSRITSNEYIRSNYSSRLEDSVFIHMDDYLDNPGIITSVYSGSKFDDYDFEFTNYPNPFNSTTTISWNNNFFEPINITIYNILGEKVVFLNLNQAGRFDRVKWDAAKFPTGIYYAVLKIKNRDNNSEKFTKTLKMLLLK